ncbi:transglutaminase-like domain-containing protein [Rhodoferax fermentans]|uniref:Transglutaminase n=1 Tax=Rhodoferax fermentans TaxID=28066 RepID=A0A1T1APQ7_RHOFE|nr:transglutaminase family protein [Rhodoferax fermentans]MBK1682633.1 transglutaminase [Rhodoferax fermentans]OOV06017.1 transglutaminase [Rhodoferax fermentans]
MTPVHTQARRAFMKNMAAAAAAASLPAISFAQNTAATEHKFAPQAGTWRSFEVTTRVNILKPQGVTRLWLPMPSVNTDWQQSLGSSFSSNGKTQITSDGRYGAQMLYVEFAENEAKPVVELTSKVRTQNRSVDWAHPHAASEDQAALNYWTQPTHLLPTDGIVRQTALQAIRGARTDVEKAQKLYDWVVVNTFREPKVQGCGEGEIQTMLETGNLGGKCADLNALFVGLCRSVGLPARDVYGLRLAPSAFGYKQLGGNSASLQGAQHCRAEVYLKQYGWVAMDPADVTKVMRQETPEWIKSSNHALVAPVNKALFGSWEGNWMAYNTAHDVTLPHSTGPRLGFLMYPVAENAAGRLDSYAPDDFKYQISARDITA